MLQYYVKIQNTIAYVYIKNSLFYSGFSLLHIKKLYFSFSTPSLAWHQSSLPFSPSQVSWDVLSHQRPNEELSTDGRRRGWFGFWVTVGGLCRYMKIVGLWWFGFLLQFESGCWVAICCCWWLWFVVGWRLLEHQIVVGHRHGVWWLVCWIVAFLLWFGSGWWFFVVGGLQFFVVDGCDLLWVGGCCSTDCCGSPTWV